jgi:SAM-dependent methyltransferase
MAGGFSLMSAVYRDEPKLAEAFKSGKGLHWGDHCNCLFCGVERFFRPGYRANLVAEWLPALDGVVEKLQRGAKVADVGCGHGASTVILARAYPKSTFVGFDYHKPSVEKARQVAKRAEVADRVTFEVARAQDFPGTGYDLVAFFDCLHDLGDPVGASRHVLKTLGKDGIWMIVEPFADDQTENNFNPIGRVFYSASTLICTPASLSQNIGLALGAQAGEKRLREVVTAGGFKRFRRAAETPFNLVFEARS